MKVEIIAIADKSGSMSRLRSDVIGGFNSFLEQQRAVPGEARMTFITFSDSHKYEVVYQAKPLADAPDLTEATYVPDGSTALLDAIGRTLDEQGKRIAEEGWADKVIVDIITDGEENASHDYKLEQIKEMIKHAEQHGWAFVFSAANQDAFQASAQYGISAATTRSFTASSAGTMQAYADKSALIGSLRAP